MDPVRQEVMGRMMTTFRAHGQAGDSVTEVRTVASSTQSFRTALGGAVRYRDLNMETGAHYLIRLRLYFGVQHFPSCRSCFV